MQQPVWEMLCVVPGTIAVVADNDRVKRIFFKATPEEAEQELITHFPDAVRGTCRRTRETLTQLAEYFGGRRRQFHVPLDDASLTPFARKVHAALCRVPCGAVISYGQLAALAGSPGAARAVGTVMSSNPFPLVVPCHRVIVSDGSLGNYTAANGSDTKAWLLEFERNHAIR